jgi:hypothetical protein
MTDQEIQTTLKQMRKMALEIIEKDRKLLEMLK